MPKANALISKGLRVKTANGPMLLGVDLQDAREETFVRMVTDGISMGAAFFRAGFKSKDNKAPARLWQLDRIQERAAVILEARRNTGVVTLPQVTSMLQRVYSNAFHADEYNAAHNAALSLARLYGHVNDRQTLEVIRRPSRDPDAPSETALSDWVAELPAINAPASGDNGSNQSVIGPLRGAPASLLAQPLPTPSETAPLASPALPTSELIDEKTNDINDLSYDVVLMATKPEIDWTAGRPENGPPARPVTGTPTQRAHSEPSAERAHSEPLGTSTHAPIPHDAQDTRDARDTRPLSAIPPLKKKKVPRKKKRVPVKKLGFPPIEDLF